MTIETARKLSDKSSSDISDEEIDHRLDIFAEFMLDRCLEKIKQDRMNKLLQEVENGGMVNI